MRLADAATFAVGPLADEERPGAAEVLARAFRDSPLNVAVIGPDPARRMRANRLGAMALLPVAVARGLVLVAREGGATRGVLVAAPPFGWPLPPPPLRAHLRRVWGQGLRVARRWGLAFEALARIHPRAPHWYLATLGIDPLVQGRGVGTALLTHWLAGVDADALPAWLETDRQANVAFYRRAGFEIERRTEVLGTTIWCMGRPERPSHPR